MQVFIVTYSHRYGTDVWPLFVADGAPAPSEEEVISELEDWEPDREEYLDITGPFVVPPVHASRQDSTSSTTKGKA